MGLFSDLSKPYFLVDKMRMGHEVPNGRTEGADTTVIQVFLGCKREADFGFSFGESL
jgi:hypothetical protein